MEWRTQGKLQKEELQTWRVNRDGIDMFKESYGLVLYAFHNVLKPRSQAGPLLSLRSVRPIATAWYHPRTLHL